MLVLVRARVSLYEARGEFQLVVEHLEEAGEGALRRRYEELRARLEAEGLFDAARKRTLPRLPRRIGLVTSPTGAALRDMLHILARRFPAVPVLIYPSPVQGAAAAGELRAAVDLAGARAEVDVLIIARGGGSIEDLWAFNDEALARALAACPVPVVSGIGHETDFTIADFVADVRAPTPSAAAELVVPDRAEWLRALRGADLRLAEAISRLLRGARDEAAGLRRRLDRQHPGQRIAARAQRLDEVESRALRAMARLLERRRSSLSGLGSALNAQSPRHRLGAGRQVLALRLSRLRAAEASVLSATRARVAALAARLREAAPFAPIDARRARLDAARVRLDAALAERRQAARGRLEVASRALAAVSPLATLERGYAVVLGPQGGLVRSVADLRAGEDIEVRLAGGRLRARITAIDPDPR